jgi:hypothetical protein
MAVKILLSTAYLPPVEYFSLISKAGEAVIEKEENYIKQSYRNRCYILSAHGPQVLTVPVYLGSQHKTAIKEIRIDYSKRWQQVHLRALKASYSSSPYYQFYYEDIESIISRRIDFLTDLNMELLVLLMKMLKLKQKITYSTHFEPEGISENDHRYNISPKKTSAFCGKEYLQVFGNAKGFIPGMSILDLIFNVGPEANEYLLTGHAMA